MARPVRKTILINFLITVVLLVLVETVSWIVLSIHEGNVESRNSALLKGQSRPAEASPTTTNFSDPDVRLDLQRAKQAGYRHEPYLVYLPRAFKSKHVNISEAGFRLNSQEPAYPKIINHKVWVFGSSALYGVTNADSETIPAHIERMLSRNYPDRAFQVRNFGIVGYNSLQDLIQFKYRLLRDKPDLVIVFSGVNDHYNAWLAPTVQDAMLATNVMPRDTLKYYAELHRESGIVNWRMVAGKIRSLFGNTVTLVDKAIKYFRLRSANSDISAWKTEYRKLRDQDLARAKMVVPQIRRMYTDNLRHMANLARDHGAKVILIHQPLLFASPKPLVGTEVAENFHPRLSFFAMSEEELQALKEVPSFRLTQTAHWTLDYFLESYRNQALALKDLSGELGAGYVDAQSVVDNAGPVAIFTSAYHFTFRGAQLLARHIVPEVERQLGLKARE